MKNQCIDELQCRLGSKISTNLVNARALPGTSGKWNCKWFLATENSICTNLTKNLDPYNSIDFDHNLFVSTLIVEIFSIIKLYSWAHSIYREKAGKLPDLFFHLNNLSVYLIGYEHTESHSSLNLAQEFQKNILKTIRFKIFHILDRLFSGR